MCCLTLIAACSEDVDVPKTPTLVTDTTVIEDAGVHDAAPPAIHDAGPAPEPDADASPPPPEDIFPYAVSNGGAVVRSPKVVPITFVNDPFATEIEVFTAKLAESSYWTAISAEYGIGAITAKTPIRIAEAPVAAISDADITAWLTDKFASDARFGGQPQPETVYAIHYPANVIISFGGSVSCTNFGGYHSETNIMGVAVSYIVIPRCVAFDGLTGIDPVTYALSHEYVEWATDPFPATSSAYSGVDPNHWIWGYAFSRELGDLCATGVDATIRPDDLDGFVVQRSWSNKAAKAGHHPCVPYPAANMPYFTAIPSLPSSVHVKTGANTVIETRALKVPVGEKRTVQVQLYADGPMKEWTLEVYDLARVKGEAAEFTYELDKDHGTNGDILTLTITGVAPAKTGYGFMLVSRSGTDVNVWPGLVWN